MSAFAHMVKVIERLERTQAPSHFNPRPAGVIQRGSSTAAVLQFFQTMGRDWVTRAQISAQVQVSEGGLDHALLFLKSLGVLETVPDQARNSRYLRYRLVAKVRL